MKDNNELLTSEQLANNEKLKLFFETESIVHITLNKRTLVGQHYYYNGIITQFFSDTLFELKDRLTNELYIFSIFQLRDDGISEYQKEESKI